MSAGLSVAELLERLAERDRLIDELRAQLARAEVRIADLEAQLKASSRNSSKPPSSDGLVKPAPKSLRGWTGLKPGGQPGHPGTRLEQVAVADEIARHEPAACAACGADLAAAVEIGAERRQVFDLPPIRAHVVEHRLIRRRCVCGTVTTGTGPVGVSAPVQYGPRIRAAMTFLHAGQFLSRQRTADTIRELCGVPVSAGTVSTATARAVTGIEASGVLDRIRDQLSVAPVAHFDETGFRVAGRLHWVHSASAGGWSLLTCHPKRGVTAMNDMGVLPAFTGVAVHDAWAPYDTFKDATHALCGAHVLRELTAVIDSTEPGDDGYCWARQAAEALLDLKTLKDAAVAQGRTMIDPALLERHALLLASAATIGITENTGRDGNFAAKHRALARRLRDRRADYLRFVTDFDVPFTNNAAEGEVRMVKVKQKVSGCLRTLTGAEGFCAIRSYLATARKHGIAFYDALLMLAQGQAWTPGIP